MAPLDFIPLHGRTLTPKRNNTGRRLRNKLLARAPGGRRNGPRPRAPPLYLCSAVAGGPPPPALPSEGAGPASTQAGCQPPEPRQRISATEDTQLWCCALATLANSQNTRDFISLSSHFGITAVLSHAAAWFSYSCYELFCDPRPCNTPSRQSAVPTWINSRAVTHDAVRNALCGEPSLPLDNRDAHHRKLRTGPQRLGMRPVAQLPCRRRTRTCAVAKGMRGAGCEF